MRSPGVVDILFRYESPIGTGVSVDALTVEIYNSNNVLKNTLVYGVDLELEEIVDVDTYYKITDYNVSNYLEYPRTWIQTKWTVDFPGSPSPATGTYYNVYWFVPVASSINNKHVLNWSASSSTNLVGYYVEAKEPGDADYTYLGATNFPFYIDDAKRSPYAFHHITYRVKKLIWGGDESSPGPVLSDQVSVSNYATDKDLCIIYGSINQINATIDEVDYIRFFVDDFTAPINTNSTHYLQNRELVVPLDSTGTFGVILVQGTVVVCEIPSIGHTKKFVVPAKAIEPLSNIDGIPIEIYRAP